MVSVWNACHDRRPVKQKLNNNNNYLTNIHFMHIKQLKMWLLYCVVIAFNALTLLVVCQEVHPACKNWVMRCWCGCLSGARCRLFAYGPADATASPRPHLSSSLVLPFWYWLTQVVLEKRPLNGCSSSNILCCILLATRYCYAFVDIWYLPVRLMNVVCWLKYLYSLW